MLVVKTALHYIHPKMAKGFLNKCKTSLFHACHVDVSAQQFSNKKTLNPNNLGPTQEIFSLSRLPFPLLTFINSWAFKSQIPISNGFTPDFNAASIKTKSHC